jgi:predicted MFS family arabinose efflux permease
MSAMTAASQFHRAAVGVVAPELAADLRLGPAALGSANTAFFLALLLAQLPVGVGLDRVGPRRLVSGLTVLAVIGSVAQALAQDGAQFLAARFLLGLGCSASFMSAVVLAGRWYAGPGLTKAMSGIFAWSQVGILVAGAPLALASGLVGWRGAYLISAALTAMAGAVWWRWTVDVPPGMTIKLHQKETLGEVLAGQFTVWRTPGLLRILSMHCFAYAVMAALLTLWAGPYLYDVHGLDAAGRGTVLLAMGLTVPCGQLALPFLERNLGREATVVASASIVIGTMAVLAAWPGVPLWMAIVLLMASCFFSAYSILLVAQGRALFPERMVGRGITTVNLGQVLGSALLPAVVGGAVALVGVGEAGYRLGFLLLGLSLVLGLAGYRWLPRGNTPP